MNWIKFGAQHASRCAAAKATKIKPFLQDEKRAGVHGKKRLYTTTMQLSSLLSVVQLAQNKVLKWLIAWNTTKSHILEIKKKNLSLDRSRTSVKASSIDVAADPNYAADYES